MVLLRDMVEADIEDYVRWFTTETEWGNWDAPWEGFEDTEEQVRKDWTERFERVKNYADDRVRYRFEIEVDGTHVGWVSAYTDLGEVENPDGDLAIGISIIEEGLRGHGYGAEALRQFIEYYRALGHSKLYTQTWSGNTRMIALAKKLGFQEVSRIIGIREVNGEKYDALTFSLDLK